MMRAQNDSRASAAPHAEAATTQRRSWPGRLGRAGRGTGKQDSEGDEEREHVAGLRPVPRGGGQAVGCLCTSWEFLGANLM